MYAQSFICPCHLFVNNIMGSRAASIKMSFGLADTSMKPFFCEHVRERTVRTESVGDLLISVRTCEQHYGFKSSVLSQRRNTSIPWHTASIYCMSHCHCTHSNTQEGMYAQQRQSMICSHHGCFVNNKMGFGLRAVESYLLENAGKSGKDHGI